MHMNDLIKSLIEENLQPSHLEIINESHKHKGHAGDDGSGQTHYKLIIVSGVFSGKSRVEKERTVLQCLEKAFERGLHAISMKLSTP